MRVIRHRTRWLVLAAAACLAATACSGAPEGVDGDLTGDWGSFAEPVGFVPEAGVCHEEPFQPSAPAAEYRPVDCAQPHLVETVHVGTFEEDAAERDAPPEVGSSALRAAYRECQKEAAKVLGADFRYGKLWLGVAVPSAAGWEGGARWFRCDLLETARVYGEPVTREGSLAGALGEDGEPDLALGCFTVEVDDSAVKRMTPVPCNEPHEAEFVGVYRSGADDYPEISDEDAEGLVHDGCREQVAKYVDVPVDGDLVFRTGTIVDWMSEDDWRAGDRGFRCYLWLPDRELTESLAGDGTDALPIQTE